MSVEVICQRAALGQHGVISRAQASALGLTARQRERLVSSGEWQVALPGVFRLAGAPATPRQDLMAACLWGGAGTAAIRRAAAGLWGMDGFREGIVEIATTKNRKPLPSDIVVYHVVEPAEMVTVRHGIPVTNPLVTFMELGAVVRPGQVARALDGALMRGQVSIKGLNWTLERHGGQGHWGASTLRELLTVRTPGYVPPEGDLEPLLWEVLRTSCLTPPERQVVVRYPDGRFLARVDFAYRHIRLAIQTDGYLFHARQADFLRDRRQDNALGALDWHVLRFTWDDVVHHPDLVIKEIAAFF